MSHPPSGSELTNGRDTYPPKWDRPSVFPSDRIKWLVYGSIILFVLYSTWQIRVTPARIATGLQTVDTLVYPLLQPDFGPANRAEITGGVIESLSMSVLATIAGVVLSIPIGFMAAENLVPKPVYYLNRGFITISRAFHSLIVAIIMVKAVGFGPLAGVITLVFKTVGFFSKLLAEDLEDIDEGQLEAIRAAGGSPMQQYVYGALPQVMPRIIGLTVYRWDINIRQSTVIGIVGAGGIGFTLLNAFNRFEFEYVSAILLTILALVLIGEGISLFIRRRVQ